MGKLEELLLEERCKLRAESQDLQEEIFKLESRLKAREERLAYVEGLLGPDHALEEAIEESPLPDSRNIIEIAVDILGERNRMPMHYRELAKEVQARGGIIPGVDKDHTLIARLVRDDRFVRPTRRGFYALRKDYPDAKNVGARKPRVNGEVESEQEIFGTPSESTN